MCTGQGRYVTFFLIIVDKQNIIHSEWIALAQKCRKHVTPNYDDWYVLIPFHVSHIPTNPSNWHPFCVYTSCVPHLNSKKKMRKKENKHRWVAGVIHINFKSHPAVPSFIHDPNFLHSVQYTFFYKDNLIRTWGWKSEWRTIGRTKAYYLKQRKL